MLSSLTLTAALLTAAAPSYATKMPDLLCQSQDLWTVKDPKGIFTATGKTKFRLMPATQSLLYCGDPFRRPQAEIRIYPQFEIKKHAPKTQPVYQMAPGGGFRFWLINSKDQTRRCDISCESAGS